MKKFISAVTSICMTATMFAAAVPASVSAQDASKTLSLRHLETGANAYTVSAEEIAAGDVTIPCALYLEEATEGEIAGILATWHVASAADADAITLSCVSGTSAGDVYAADAEQTYTTSEGTEFTTTMLPFFSGSVRRGAYSMNATDVAANYNESIESIIYSWTSYNGSTWLGATSDEYPVYYFDVTLAKDAAAGEYVIDFNDYFRDEPTNLQPSNFLGAMTTNYEYTALLEGEGLLNFEPLTITVEGDVVDDTTTTTPAPDVPDDTTTTTPAPVDPDQPSDAAIVLDYAYEEGLDYYQADPGETIYVDMLIDSNGNEIISFEGYLKADDGLQIDYIAGESPAFGGAGVVANWLGNPASTGSTIVDPNGTNVNGTFNGKIVPAAVPDSNEFFISMDVTVPEEEGVYYIDMTYSRFAKDQAPTYYDASEVSYTPAKIVVGDPVVEPGTTTTTTEPPVTTTTTTTTEPPVTTTTTTPAPGERYLGDANCDNEVNVADVVVLNKRLAGNGDLSDQGKINAEVTDPTLDVAAVDLSYDDSTYIIQSIIHLWTLTDEGPVMHSSHPDYVAE